MKKERSFFKGLGGKLTIMCLAISIIPLVVSIILASYLSTNEIESLVYEESTIFAKLKINYIDNWFQSHENNLKTVAQDRAIYQSLDIFKEIDYDKTNDKFKERYEIMDKYLMHFKKTYAYAQVTIFNDKGIRIYSTEKNLEGQDGSNTEYFKVAMTNKSYTLALEYNDVVKDVIVGIIEPILSNGDSGKLIGAIICIIPGTEIQKIVTNGIDALGNTADIYLINENKTLVTNSRLDNSLEVFKSKIETENSKNVVENAIKKNDSSYIFNGEYTNNKGDDVLGVGAMVKFGEHKYGMIVGKKSSEAFAGANFLQLALYLILGIAAIIVIIISVVFAKSLTNPIIEGVNFAQQIANKNLTNELNINRNDEIGLLANALNMMKRQLMEIIEKLNEVATHLAASSEQINAAAQSLSDGAQTQAASVEETSSSMEELTASIEQISANSVEVADKSRNLEKISEDSQNLISNTVTGMQKIQVSSAKIEEIIGVINDIADQTNLLSLNASIEAARAGEHGRGFAVVAEEISKLADRSGISTKEVGKLVKESLENVSIGVDLVNKSGNAFNEIYEDVKANVELLNGIVQAIGQQSEGADQVQKAMNQINEITQTVSASSEEMTGSTAELQKQAEELKEIIDQFIIDKKQSVTTITKNVHDNKEKKGVVPVNKD